MTSIQNFKKWLGEAGSVLQEYNMISIFSPSAFFFLYCTHKIQTKYSLKQIKSCIFKIENNWLGKIKILKNEEQK